MNCKGFHHLTWEDRLTIEKMLKIAVKPSEIAKALGVSLATIYNEIKRGMCMQQMTDYQYIERYCADFAERKYQENLRAKGVDIKLGHDYAFATYIEEQIVEKKRSPAAALAQVQIDGLIFHTNICVNTLYNWIYRGDVFMELTQKHLLRKGKRSKKNTSVSKRSRVAHGYTIEQRPKDINERSTFGHWEMDSIVGCRGSKSALLVLTERITRSPIIFKVKDHTMQSVVAALNGLERKLGKQFKSISKSITVDNGCEFQDCVGMEKSIRTRKNRTTIYYCHPYSSCERGSNENMNGIIRRWFPKGTNFDNITQSEVKFVEDWLANYPRKILGWKTSKMLFDEYISA